MNLLSSKIHKNAYVIGCPLHRRLTGQAIREAQGMGPSISLGGVS